MNAVSESQMHADHTRWITEDAAWRDDLRVWQEETKQAVAQIEELNELFNKHAARLATHAAAIRSYELEARSHEHAVAEHQRGNASTDIAAVAAEHPKDAVQHNKQRLAHERLKKSHHSMIAQWNTLLRALQEAVS